MPKYAQRHNDEQLIQSYELLLKAINALPESRNELLGALNSLRVCPEICTECLNYKSAMRKVRKKLTEKNKEIKDLKNRIALLKNPRQGMTKFRAPEPSIIEADALEENDVQEFARAIQTGAFSRFPIG